MNKFCHHHFDSDINFVYLFVFFILVLEIPIPFLQKHILGISRFQVHHPNHSAALSYNMDGFFSAFKLLILKTLLYLFCVLYPVYNLSLPSLY